ncbi:histone H1-like [Diachasmimorpha longicaudata]|uniref:histone H1-like n=1 Tax=Diachasmimorpha longicaudata TaxID=58733 RepID=UPI0030B8931A
MTDKVAAPVVAVGSASPAPAKTEVAKKAPKAKNPKPKPTHPSTADMVNAAVKTLAERNGSSLQAIKKYIASTYKIDTTKHALFIKKYLKSAVTAGTLVQTKGNGASGSFKLAVKKADASKPKSKPATTKKEGSPKKTVVKKLSAKKVESAKPKAKKAASPKKISPKKPAAEKKVAKPKVTKTAKTPKSPKAKKATKGPTAKPKVPKPKKAAPLKTKAAAKKVSPKK